MWACETEVFELSNVPLARTPFTISLLSTRMPYIRAHLSNHKTQRETKRQANGEETAKETSRRDTGASFRGTENARCTQEDKSTSVSTRQGKSTTTALFLSVEVVGFWLLERSVSTCSSALASGRSSLDTTLGELERRAERTRLLKSLSEHLVSSDVGVGNCEESNRLRSASERQQQWTRGQDRRTMVSETHHFAWRTSWPPQSEQW